MPVPVVLLTAVAAGNYCYYFWPSALTCSCQLDISGIPRTQCVVVWTGSSDDLNVYSLFVFLVVFFFRNVKTSLLSVIQIDR